MNWMTQTFFPLILKNNSLNNYSKIILLSAVLSLLIVPAHGQNSCPFENCTIILEDNSGDNWTSKDYLGIIIIPVIITFLGLLWPDIQSRFRRKKFEEQIYRELSELDPFLGNRRR